MFLAFRCRESSLDIGKLTLHGEELSLVGIDSVLGSALIGERSNQVEALRNEIGFFTPKFS